MGPAGANYWPTAEQQLILCAALARDPAAGEAWSELRRRLDFDRLDPASSRLLPLVHRNLQRLDIDDPILDRCAGLHRYHWSRNQMLFHRGATALDALRAAGVDSMLLKGAALVSAYYGDPGLRAMEDLDVWVPAGAVGRAAAALEACGWRPRYRLTPAFLRVKHAAPFGDGGGHQLDLHWHVFEECCAPGDDDDLREASVEIEFLGRPTRVLCPADQLLHACVHGARWAPVAAIRWIADAVTILRKGDVDWCRVVEQATRRRFVLRMSDALGYLHGAMAAPVPEGVVDALAARRTDRFERLERRLLAREHRLLGQLPFYWCHHLRACGGDLLAAALTFPRYLQYAWDLATLGGLPRSALRRALKRFRGAGVGTA